MRKNHGFAAFLTAVAVLCAVALGLCGSGGRAALPVCPTQKQLEQRGATASEVSSAPQTSTENFPITSTLTAPVVQCSYQGSLTLLLLYWQLSPAQQPVAKAHFAFECQQKTPCTIFLAKGSNTVVETTPGGQTTTKQRPTLNEVVIAGSLNGEAEATNPPSSHARCDELAQTLFGFFAGGATVGKKTALLRAEFDCPS
jgi:hypothetical protein